MIVRLATILAATALLAGCSTEEGLRAQELLQQAEVAQAHLRSSSFDGSVAVSAGGAKFRLLFNGVTSQEGEWVSLRASGLPGGRDFALQVLVRGGRGWLKQDGRWESAPLPAGAGANGTLSAAAFQQLARYVKDVRVTEHQLILGKPVTTIAGEIDTEGMLESLLELGSFAEGMSFDLSKLDLDVGDIRAVLTIDERTQLLDTVFVTFSMAADGERVQIDLRYRLASANEPVELPSPRG